ncbi:hypothetical protein [Desulfovibrio sp. TomC]|uniref:hypothetical protein n=1 Tax=Desulfovibrio sp. TomC TaxID=1562888 RepID=UPI0012E1FB56|nr:hypothetical protein [Desulfovibrio sp. TomC]
MINGRAQRRPAGQKGYKTTLDKNTVACRLSTGEWIQPEKEFGRGRLQAPCANLQHACIFATRENQPQTAISDLQTLETAILMQICNEIGAWRPSRPARNAAIPPEINFYSLHFK